ncbi:MAG: sensor histidine kinase [Anaerolineae bacterium]
MLELLDVNWVILYFVYGQVFFIMGLAVALQLRGRRSKLELARSLPWLAGFGIAHGLTEWGYIFIPLQTLYLPSWLVALSRIAHLVLLAFSFFCLLQFGLQAVLSRGHSPPWLSLLPTIVFLVWGGVLLVGGMLGRVPLDVLWNIGSALARYAMAFPGSCLACVGLLRQERQAKDMGVTHITLYLRASAVAFAGYAVVGGLIVPAAPFFPASVLNYDLVMRALHVPTPVFRSLCGLVMAFCIIRSLEIFQAEMARLIAAMEHEQLVMADRERIGRELHDGIIQSIYATGLAMEDAFHLAQEDPPRARKRIQSAMESLDRIIGDIRDYIFELRTAEGSLELENELQSLVHDIRVDTLLEAEFRVEGRRCCTPPADVTAQLIQIAREALSNVVQHAQAKNVMLSLRYKGDHMQLVVADDGVGLKDCPPSMNGHNGQGIANMQERARLMGGSCEFVCPPEGGLTVIATAPCPPEPLAQEGSSE